MHNVFNLEIQPVESSKLLFRFKAEKATSKNQHAIFFSIQLLCFPERLYIISSTDQSLFGFFFTNIENYSELLGSCFYRFILKKNPKQYNKHILFPLCYQNKNPLFAEVIQILYFTTTFFIKLRSVLPFLYTLLLSALVRIAIHKQQDNPWSLGPP